jgi:hypothetical protein
MDIIGNVKEIADLAKKFNDIEFYRRIVDLEGEVIELTRAKRETERKVEDLQKQLTLKAKMTFRQPFYYQEGDDVPFCPSCFEKDTLAVHLFFVFDRSDLTRWDCHVCAQTFGVKKAEGHARSAPRIRTTPF